MNRLRLFPLVILYLVGFLTLFSILSGNATTLSNVAGIFAVWVGVIASVALLIGLGNVGRVHSLRISRRERGYGYSIVLLLSAAITIALGIASRLAGQGPAWSDFIFQYIYQPLTLALFGVLAFVLATTAVRALLASTVESALMLGGAVIVLLGAIALPPFDSLRPVVDWFQNFPVTAALRGLLIGVGLGATMTSLRYLLGVDNRYVR